MQPENRKSSLKEIFRGSCINTRRNAVGIDRRVYILILVAVMALVFSLAPEQLHAKNLLVGLESKPKTLDPRYATDASGMRISHHLIFSTLVQLGYDLQIVPSLAERWEAPDNSTYIFHLQDKVFFHDGRPLTADDVKFTFEHLMDRATKSPFAATYKSKIAHIEVIGPYTVKFILTQPVASFLTSVIMPIVPKHLLLKGDDFGGRLVGSGPFKFVSQSPTAIELVPNKHYFDGAPKLGRLVFKVVKDDNTRFLKMRKSELDLLINAIPNNKIDDFKKPPLSHLYRVIEEPGISYNYLGFNMQDPKVRDIRVRQAIAYGINVEEIIGYRLHGHAIPATGLLSSINWYYTSEVSKYPYDPEKAKRLLETAGLIDPDGDGPEPCLTLELKTSNNVQVVGIARIIQAQLAQIGIRLELKSYEWGTFYGDIKSGNFQLTAMRWVGVTEPDFYYDIFHSSQIPPAGRNRGRYVNPRIDDLVEEGRITLDPVKRKTIYAEIQQIVSKDLPYISLWHLNNVSIVHKRVSGYRQHPMGSFLSFKDIVLQ